MKSTDADGPAVRFLCGEVSEEERAAVEERFLADDAAFAELLVAEEELLEAVALGAVSADRQRQLLERWWVVPALRRELEFARALVGVANRSRSLGRAGRLPRWLRTKFSTFRTPAFGLATAVILVAIAAVTWLALENRSLKRRVATLKVEADRARQSNAAIRANEADAPPPAPTDAPSVPTALPSRRSSARVVTHPVVASFVLAAGASRGGEGMDLPVGSATLVRLRLELPREGLAPSYGARLSTAEGVPVLEMDALSAVEIGAGQQVVLDIPADVLIGADYILTLTGQTPDGTFEETATYVFRIVK